ncbi:MAG: DUF1467 family protein [Pseudomonadota bacterium]
MGWLGGSISFIFIWAFVMLVVLPRGQRTQAEQGEVERGTPPGAPAKFDLRMRLLYGTAIAAAFWAPIALAVTAGWVSLDDFDFLTPQSIIDGLK